MTDLIEIGLRIKAQRELLCMTREELAEKLDITPRFCYDIELGNKGMSLSTLCKLSKTLNISTDYLLFGEEKEDNGLYESISLCKRCPIPKRSYLNKIISEFIQATET